MRISQCDHNSDSFGRVLGMKTRLLDGVRETADVNTLSRSLAARERRERAVAGWGSGVQRRDVCLFVCFNGRTKSIYQRMGEMDKAGE